MNSLTRSSVQKKTDIITTYANNHLIEQEKIVDEHSHGKIELMKFTLDKKERALVLKYLKMQAIKDKLIHVLTLNVSQEY
jgi:ribosomal protein L25 (general stress protein Ctc)